MKEAKWRRRPQPSVEAKTPPRARHSSPFLFFSALDDRHCERDDMPLAKKTVSGESAVFSFPELTAFKSAAKSWWWLVGGVLISPTLPSSQHPHLHRLLPNSQCHVFVSCGQYFSIWGAAPPGPAVWYDAGDMK